MYHPDAKCQNCVEMHPYTRNKSLKGQSGINVGFWRVAKQVVSLYPYSMTHCASVCLDEIQKWYLVVYGRLWSTSHYVYQLIYSWHIRNDFLNKIQSCESSLTDSNAQIYYGITNLTSFKGKLVGTWVLYLGFTPNACGAPVFAMCLHPLPQHFGYTCAPFSLSARPLGHVMGKGFAKVL